MKKNPISAALYGEGESHLTAKDKARTLLRIHGRSAANGSRNIAHETIEIREKTLFMVIDQLMEGGFAITDLAKLQHKHLEYLARRWESEGLSAGTMQNRWSILKTMLEKWCGRRGSISKIQQYLIDPARAQRNYLPKEDKSWSAKLDPLSIISLVFRTDKFVGHQLQLMLAFGLRRKEAIMYRPHSYDMGGHILIINGSKGGRPRVVPVEKPSQRELLDELKRQYPHPRSHLGNPRLSLKQNINRFENVLTRIGVTKAGLGITSHGLRHQFCNDLIEEKSGEQTPIRSGRQPVDRGRFEEARWQATLALGHSRTCITSIYHGGLRAMKGNATNEVGAASTIDAQVGQEQLPVNDIKPIDNESS